MLARIIIFGASGDLTGRLLMPAIAQVAASGLLPEGLSIVGSAMEDWSSSRFRRHVESQLQAHAAGVSAAARADVVRRSSYAASDVSLAADVKKVVGVDHVPTLVYLALPSGLIERALGGLSGANLNRHDAVAIEKPFGDSRESARRLNGLIAEKLHQPNVFRVDHFLSDELVRRILALRFMNRVFEPAFNGREVEKVEIKWLEKLVLEGRAGYYDRAGALKDMIQNHLLEALSLVLMHQPARLDASSFRGARVEALRSIATPTTDDIQRGTFRARYAAGKIGDRNVPSYVDEPGVDPARNTETYARVELQVPTARWQDTRFVLSSGKGMPEDRAEIALHFRKVPSYLGRNLDGIRENVLRVGLMSPYVQLDANVNGPNFSPVAQQLDMRSAEPRHSPYANLILEMLQARPMLFIRGDEAEEAWRIVDPICAAFRDNRVPLHEYPAGCMPSAAALGS